MGHKTALLLLLGIIAFGLTQIAVADIIQDLTADITCYPCDGHSMFATMNPLRGPLPAIGWANYSFMGLPWSWQFRTGMPTSYTDDGPFQYALQFGVGGSFVMTGPQGLTFAGVIESGNSINVGLGLEQISLNFSGAWSDGAQAVGSIFQRYNVGWTWNPFNPFGPPLPVGEWSELHTHPTTAPVSSTPEPGALLLLGTAVLGAWRYRRSCLR